MERRYCVIYERCVKKKSDPPSQSECIITLALHNITIKVLWWKQFPLLSFLERNTGVSLLRVLYQANIRYITTIQYQGNLINSPSLHSDS